MRFVFILFRPYSKLFMSKYILLSISMASATTQTSETCAPGSGPGLGSLASSCVPCPAGTWSSGGSTACTPCEAGYFTGVKTGAAACTSFCSAGSIPSGDSSTCVPCSMGSYGVLRASSCKACAAGEYTAGSGATSCLSCPAGYYCPTNSLPVMCLAGKTSPSGSSALSDCKPICSGNGKIPSDSNSCTCNPGFTGSNCEVQCSGVGKVVDGACSCQPGYSNPTGDSLSCSACAVGFYGTSAVDSTTLVAQSCTRCPATFTTSGVAAGKTVNDCVCAVGRVMNPANLNQCSPCTDIDPYSTTAAAGSTSCTCIAGYYPGSTGACTSCGGASFTTTVGSATSASSCVCTDGFTSTSSSVNDCAVECFGHGKLMNGQCKCQPGWTTSGLNTGVYCDICDTGFFGAAGACSPCPGKTTTLNAGANPTSSSCDVCQTGWTNPAGSTGAVCTWQCNAGNGYSKNDCTSACLPGWYKDSVEGSATNGLCVSCGTGTTSPAGSTASSQCTCAAGLYKSSTGCVACPAGLTSVAGNGDATSCGCAVGWFTATSGTQPCQACPSGKTTAAVGSTASSACKCAIGSYVGESDNCVTCGGTGYTTAEIGSSSSSSCMCGVGWFQTGSSPLICSACDAGQTSAAGSTSRAGCNSCAAGYFPISGSSSTLTCSPCSGLTGSQIPEAAVGVCGTSFVISAVNKAAGQDVSQGQMHPLNENGNGSNRSAMHQLKMASSKLRKLQENAHRLLPHY